jgi:protein SCO1
MMRRSSSGRGNIKRMTYRARLVLGVAVVIAGSAGVLVLASLRGGSTDGDKVYRGSTLAATYEIPAFSLRDQDGRLLTSSELRGHVTVLTFIDTDCKESCPVIAGMIGSAIPQLDADERRQVRAVAITVNPDADTPAKVHRFLRDRRALGTLDFGLGSLAELRPLWRKFKILSAHETGDPDLHSAPVRIYDRNGIWVSTLHAGADLSVENLIHDVRHALEQ